MRKDEILNELVEKYCDNIDCGNCYAKENCKINNSYNLEIKCKAHLKAIFVQAEK